MDNSILESAEKLAVNEIKNAGLLLKQGFHNIKEIKQKGARDFVTNLDQEIEDYLVSAIQKQFPDHTIIGEESGITQHDSEYTWIIDPIDGTMNFIHGHPPFRIGIGLIYKKTPVLSVLYGPTRDTLYLGVKGKGASLNGKKIGVTSHESLSDSLVMTHFSSKKLPRLQTILSLENIFNSSMQIRVLGSGLAAMCYIANGEYDVFFNVKTNIWDIFPAITLVEEAGGRVTDLEGKDITFESDSVLVTNGKVHDQVLLLLKSI